jgi:hypothetical protein
VSMLSGSLLDDYPSFKLLLALAYFSEIVIVVKFAIELRCCSDMFSHLLLGVTADTLLHAISDLVSPPPIGQVAFLDSRLQPPARSQPVALTIMCTTVTLLPFSIHCVIRHVSMWIDLGINAFPDV